jgi:hypothetical protein
VTDVDTNTTTDVSNDVRKLEYELDVNVANGAKKAQTVKRRLACGYPGSIVVRDPYEGVDLAFINRSVKLVAVTDLSDLYKQFPGVEYQRQRWAALSDSIRKTIENVANAKERATCEYNKAVTGHAYFTGVLPLELFMNMPTERNGVKTYLWLWRKNQPVEI